MRTLVLLLALTIAACAEGAPAQAAFGITGHWRTLSVTDPEGIGPAAVEFTFRPDGTYLTREDDGHGILAAFSGTFVFDGDNLRLRPEWAKTPSDCSARLREDLLTLTQNGRADWKHVLERSADLHPALLDLPRVPRSVDEAVTTLRNVLPKERLEEIRKMPTGSVEDLHFGLGLWIRNAFRLWRGNTELLESCGSAEMMSDKASGVILDALWHSLKEAK